MTIHYLSDVNKSGFGAFLKLLFRWDGGIMKLVLKELLVFLTAFYILNIIYRFSLTADAQKRFIMTAKQWKVYQEKIPISLLLGFFISAVYANFTQKFSNIPWIMNLSTQLAFYIPGNGERERLYRNYILRYLNIALIMTIMRVHKHTMLLDMSSLVERNLLTPVEMEMINKIPFIHIQPFIPISWCMTLLVDARNEDLFTNIHGFVFLVEDLNTFRQGLLKIFISDQISFPLIYTQVNTVAVYAYFFFSILTAQVTSYNGMDIYFPVIAVIEFLVYVGLLKCAIGMLNPMGNNEENFEMNEIIMYNWLVGYCITETSINSAPSKLQKDKHWDVTQVGIDLVDKRRANLNG